MPYELVSYTTYLAETLALLEEPGCLLVAIDPAGKPNAMTIGWGTVGIIWGKQIFNVLVRPSRYTYDLIEQSDSFTVCVPRPEMHAAVDYCGQYSGRTQDKLAACNLTAIPSTKIAAPGIDGCPVIYECRIVHHNDVDPKTLAPYITSYPRGDFHRIYSGEILAVRALPDAPSLLAPRP